MNIFVDFNLGNLSDRILNMFLRSGHPKTPLAQALYDELVAEKAARQQSPYAPREGFRMQVELDPTDYRALAENLGRLLFDINELEQAAALTPPGSPVDVEISSACLLLVRIGEAVRGFRPPLGTLV